VNRRAVVTAVVAVVLLVVGIVCLVHGVDRSPSTGGLLVSPVPLTRVLGAWVASGVVLVTAALVCGIDALARWRVTRSERAVRSGV
jgi:preprotein translocase subunit SecE